jgi:hypothetical protein
MDVFERRKMFKELADPNVSRETVEKYRKIMLEEQQQEREEERLDDNYGPAMNMDKEAVYGSVRTSIEARDNDAVKYKGERIEAEFGGKRLPYFVTDSWISGKGISVERAYRIFEENDNQMTVRRVQNPSEFRSIEKGLVEAIGKLLRRKK